MITPKQRLIERLMQDRVWSAIAKALRKDADGAEEAAVGGDLILVADAVRGLTENAVVHDDDPYHFNIGKPPL